MSSSRSVRLLRRLSLAVVAGGVGLMASSIVGQPPALAPAARAATEARAKGKDYDLASMELLRKVVVYIKDNYVEPRRIDPKEMFVAAMEGVEKNTAEVLVEGTAKDGRIKLTVAGHVREIEFNDVTTLWMVPHRIRPAFEFIQKHLVSTENRRDIEYAAINGMLSTLDPHSWMLKPDNYREMKLQTRGEFGGLGFVVSMDEDRLTVRKVLKNTPAARSGLHKGDHIARIDDESTINMELNEAVSKLRGKPGTEVRLFVRRGSEPEKTYRVTRDIISVESVTSRLLPDGVGYVRLASFAGTTSRDLAAAIREMKGQSGGKLKGLVLDLRSNPGGLLDQAHAVADQFVESGAIVTTSGFGERQREPKMARNDPGDREFPVAVLVNSESASASEIVAGALKNLDRAVIVGRQTFGKGSVQVLYDMQEPVTHEEGALKLTIAQYLTPGDKSIQEIGVTPDIELLPAKVTADRVDLYAPPRMVREADLDKHFANGFAPAEAARQAALQAEKPGDTLRYLRAEKPVKETTKTANANRGDDSDEDETEEPDEDAVLSDNQVEFARNLLLRAPQTTREGMLRAAKSYLGDYRMVQDSKIEKALTELGLDWSVSATPPAGRPEADVQLVASPARLVPGEEATLTLNVTNTGNAPFERLRAFTRCDAERTAYQALCGLLARREFPLGRVAPGEKRSWTTKFKVPAHLPTAHEAVALVFQDAHGAAPAERPVELETGDTPHPAFGYTVQVLDEDGLASPGQTVDVELTVRNVGTGAARNAFVSLRNPGNDKLFLKKGRMALGALKPGETRTALLSLELKEGAPVADGLPVKVELGDRDLWEFTSDKLSLPAAASPLNVKDMSGALTVARDGVALLGAPQAGAPRVAEAKKATPLPVVGRAGDFWKVEWSKGRWAWVAAADASFTPGNRPGKGEPRAEVALLHSPPDIALKGVETGRPLVVDGERIKLSGLASSGAGLLDVRVFVDNEKALFRGGEAGQPKPRQLAFEADLSLKPGNNHVLIMAREDEEFSSQRSLIIYRRPSALADKKAAPATPATPAH